MITGPLADVRLQFGRGLAALGFDMGDEVANTEAFMASRARDVGRLIELFGAGTGLSDADREYAERAAAGKIQLTEKSIRRILDINDRASRNVIGRYNRDVSGLSPDEARFLPSIQIPETTAPEAPETSPETKRYVFDPETGQLVPQ